MCPKLAYKSSFVLGFLLVLLSMFSTKIFSAEAVSENPVFARINDRVITYNEFMDIFRTAVRYKYYHGKVPQNELQSFQLQVGKDIVEQVLLHQQALKLGLQPDKEKIKSGFDKYDKKYATNQEWQAQKEKNYQLLLKRLERQDLIEQMKSKIQNVDKPDNRHVEKYYKQHPEKFTEPKRVWLSVILLSVPPASAKQTWLDAEKAANQFIERIKQGESFADIANQFSAHPSAVNGGDLGYLHQGMLEGDAKKVVENLKKNEISKPVHVLEGITVFRLNGIQPAKLKSFNEVKQRAADLLYRELQDKTWKKYLKQLTSTADVFVNEKLYAAVAEK